jgi:PII-like signaling protein
MASCRRTLATCLRGLFTCFHVPAPTISQPAQPLRLYVSEQDKHTHQPLYEALVYAARQADLAGATAIKDVLGFGAQGQVESTKLLTLAENLPLVLEFVDSPAIIARFLPEAERLFSEADSGGLAPSARCKPRITKPSPMARTPLLPPIVRELGELRIYCTQADKHATPGLRGRFLPDPLAHALVDKAHAFGILQATTHTSGYGYVLGGSVRACHLEVESGQLALCMELLDERVRLLAFCQ